MLRLPNGTHSHLASPASKACNESDRHDKPEKGNVEAAAHGKCIRKKQKCILFLFPPTTKPYSPPSKMQVRRGKGGEWLDGGTAQIRALCREAQAPKRAFAGRRRIVGGGWLSLLSISVFLFGVERGFFLGLILYLGVGQRNK